MKRIFLTKGVAHIVHLKFQKNKQDSFREYVLSTLNFPNLVSVCPGTVASFREQQKPVFAQKQARKDNFNQNDVIMLKITVYV